MRPILFFVLFVYLVDIVHGFVYGLEEPIKYCERHLCSRPLSESERYVKFVGEYTEWPIPCPFHNRITVECSGFINPNAKIELYDLDGITSDDLIATFKWAHIHEGKKRAYFDAFASVRTLDSIESFTESQAELYFKYYNPCLGQQNKEYIIQNVVLNYTFIPE
uniref:Uncharacterized protein n=1 Tax=Panagrolaimus sp. JU765 TaxID=591449 RepID=A0AC34RL97_9BILA